MPTDFLMRLEAEQAEKWPPDSSSLSSAGEPSLFSTLLPIFKLPLARDAGRLFSGKLTWPTERWFLQLVDTPAAKVIDSVAPNLASRSTTDHNTGILA